jgi:hypothetical protein
MIAAAPCAKASAPNPTTAAAEARMITPRTASRRSANRVANGIATMRITAGIASTMPIEPASRPLTVSQSGKNGSCTPKVRNKAA